MLIIELKIGIYVFTIEYRWLKNLMFCKPPSYQEFLEWIISKQRQNLFNRLLPTKVWPNFFSCTFFIEKNRYENGLIGFSIRCDVTGKHWAKYNRFRNNSYMPQRSLKSIVLKCWYLTFCVDKQGQILEDVEEMRACCYWVLQYYNLFQG